MGHFSHNCKLSGLPITGGNAVLIVMKPQKNLWDNSEEKLRKYGKTYMCSNDGPRLKYIPCWYPIKGEYDTYGGLENIVHDDNTAVLEEYYGLSIEELVDIVTSGRKDDGYDDALSVIKKKPEYPEDWIEGEDHFKRYQRITGDVQPFDGRYPTENKNKYRVYRDGKMVDATKEEYDADYKLIHEQYARYQEWKKTNPDYDDDYGNPQYQEKYEELLTLSGMWIHGDLYEQLTNEKITDVWRDGLDLGTPELLNALGFTELYQRGSGRYNRRFEKDGLILKSDGTWLEVPNEHIYRLKDLKKYCNKKGVNIDIDEIEKKDFHEQVLDYVIPTFKIPNKERKLSKDELDSYKERFKKLQEKTEDNDVKELLDFNDEDELADLISAITDRISNNNSHLALRVYHMFLNTDRYGGTGITNPLTTIYMEKAKEGKLRNNIVEFWRFDQYMYACGKYYEIVGTGPQDGDHKMVLKVLETASSILKEQIKEYYDDEDEWDDDDDE